jgi:hypothetical protein
LLGGGAVLVVAPVLVGLQVWRWFGWAARLVAAYPGSVVAFLLGLLLAVAGVGVLRQARHAAGGRSSRPPSRWLWLLSDRGVAAVVATVAGLGLAALLWMLHVASQAPTGLGAGSRSTLRIEAIKYGLGSIAVGGAAAALLLAMRRQRLAERTQVHVEEDAAEQRVTELYTRAVEQLGSADAAVRLGGLYALERVAQNNLAQRQTIVNVLCAYLRMPYTPTPDGQHNSDNSAAETESGSEKPTEPHPSLHRDRDPREELQVRLTAQSILTSHLFTQDTSTEWPRRSLPSDPEFWPGIELDLAGATLVDFVLQGRVQIANFSGARFIGGSNFAHAEFDGHVYFRGARFEGGSAHFYGAWFGLRAVFTDTDFGLEEANFMGATFCGMTFFRGADMRGGATFGAARALVDFDVNWGDQRQWPSGWTERPLLPDEQMPRTGRWEASAGQLAPGDGTWALVREDLNRRRENPRQTRPLARRGRRPSRRGNGH